MKNGASWNLGRVSTATKYLRLNGGWLILSNALLKHRSVRLAIVLLRTRTCNCIHWENAKVMSLRTRHKSKESFRKEWKRLKSFRKMNAVKKRKWRPKEQRKNRLSRNRRIWQRNNKCKRRHNQLINHKDYLRFYSLAHSQNLRVHNRFLYQLQLSPLSLANSKLSQQALNQ